MSGADVVIVGAGAAGLAAAGLLRRAGRCVIVIEAAPTIGGRARTVRPPALGGASIDEGATWLHQVDRNPLVMLARAAGDPLHAAHQGGRLLMVGDRPASDDEEQAYGAADEAWRSHVRRRLTDADCTLAEAGSGFDDPWQGNLEAWEGAIIAAADAGRAVAARLAPQPSRRWAQPRRAQGGLGTFRGRAGSGRSAGSGADLGLAAYRDRLGRWQDGVAVTTTAEGVIEGASPVIVTVSTGVLRRRTPRLRRRRCRPSHAGRARRLAAWGCSARSRCAPRPCEDRLGLPSSCTLIEPRTLRPVRAGDDASQRLAGSRRRPRDRLRRRPIRMPGSSQAVRGHAAAFEAFARDQLAVDAGRRCGDACGRHRRGCRASDWGSTTRCFLGAYAYAQARMRGVARGSGPVNWPMDG